MANPVLLVADKNKKIYDIPNFMACGMAGNRLHILNIEDLIPLPSASEIFILPDRYPIGFNIEKNEYQILSQLYPVSAFIPPGYIQLLSTAHRERQKAKILPLFSYTPIAWYKNKYYVPALRIDKRRVHDIRYMNIDKALESIRYFRNTKNRLIEHLQSCALNYKCPNAINFFLSRYECPLPVSPYCNSKCIGCISFQPKGSCPPTQKRIEFIPKPEEIAEVALMHIMNVHNPVVSFGQGCEGEPLLAIDVISKAIEIIRGNTKKGTINVNTNASIPSAVELLCKTGLDSLRVSLNSVREKFYNRYYKPHNYTFRNVIESINIAKKNKKFVSINYLFMPGFTDELDEFNQLIKFIKKTKIAMIQWRNLNYDPLRYFKKINIKQMENLLGIKNIIYKLRGIFPSLRHGYFNLPKEMWF